MLALSLRGLGMLKRLTILITVIATSCNLLSEQDYGEASSPVPLLKEGVVQPCSEIKRPLNPSDEPTASESELDKHFRQAFDYETAGEFEQAIFHYHLAAQLSECDCDRLHAEAGKTAAQEAKDLWEQQRMAAKPTQYFWGAASGTNQNSALYRNP